MIKRPLVIILLSFVLGSMLSQFRVLLIIPLVIMAFLLIIGVLYVFQLDNKYINSSDYFLVVLPIIFYLGYVLMIGQQEINPMDHEFERKINGNITGTIYMIVNKEKGSQLYLKDNLIELEDSSIHYSSEKIILYIDTNNEIKIGNIIRAYGEIHKFKTATNLGQFDEKKYYQGGGIDYKVYGKSWDIIDSNYNIFLHSLYNVKGRLVEVYAEILNQENAALISAMLLGEKGMLGEEIKELYQDNGITHILAISGMHVSLIGLSIYKVLKIIGLHQCGATILSIGMIYSYGWLTNFSVSTNRAVVMLVVALCGSLIGRTYDLLSAMSLSGLIILIQNPMSIYDVGFLLSFGAVMGIGIIMPILNNLIEEFYPNKYLSLRNSVIACISVNIMTLPLLLYYFYEIPLYSLIVNLLIIPPMAILTWVSIIAGIIGCYSISYARGFIGGVHYILEWYEALCRFFQNMPGHMMVVGKPSLLKVLIYYSILGIGLFLIKKYMKKRYSTILLFLIFILIPKRHNNLNITFLDVSQGDGIYIRTPSNNSYMIDGGSSDVSKVGRYRIIPFLKASGIHRLDYVFITHFDQDHVSGIKELCINDRIEIDNVVISSGIIQDEEYDEFVELCYLYEINVVYMEQGDVLQDGEVIFRCIYPANEYTTDSRNDTSMVLSIEYGDFEGLCMGDLEEGGEQKLLSEKQRGKIDLASEYDVLKVGHHGSKHSSSMYFLEEIKPQISIISCGTGNRYGHPHDETLERLEAVGSKVYITTEEGAITIQTNGRKGNIQKYRR